MSFVRVEPRELFALLADPQTIPEFFDHVADDVTWTVMGTHPMAGTYRGKQEFLAATHQRLERLMSDRVRLQVRRLHLAGDRVIAELVSQATTLEGRGYDNTYCWICRFSGDTIVEVVAYLDSALVADTIARNERP